MSTKIYTAYRSKPGVELWPLVTSLRARVEREIQSTLRQEILRLKKEDAKLTFFGAFDVIQKHFREDHPKPERTHWGMDVSLVFREHRGRLYIIPYANGLMWRVWKFLERLALLEDFHYQNSGDKSAPISDKAWETRRRVWNEYLEGNDGAHWHDRLALEVLVPETLFRIGYPVVLKLSGKRL